MSRFDYKVVEMPIPPKKKKANPDPLIMNLTDNQAILFETKNRAVYMSARMRRLGFRPVMRQVAEGFAVWRGSREQD